MRLVLTSLWIALTVAYPLVVYVGLRHWPPHVLSLVLLGLLGLLEGARRLLARRSPAASVSRGAAAGPWLVAGLLAIGALLRHGVFVKAIPVLVSGSLLVTFALSLRSPQSPQSPQSLVERLARRQDPELTPDKVRYCRQVTGVWVGFFAVNIAVTLGLAIAAPVSWWTLYTGLVAYLLIGALLVGEYVVRKARFRDYGVAWYDRALAAVLPPRGTDG